MTPTRVQPHPGALRVERLPDGRRQLVRDLRVDVSRDVDGSDIVDIPRDFVTDYSSLPWGTRWLVHWSRVDVAGVVHDYLYRCGGKVRDTYPKGQSDRIWRWIALSGDRRAWRYQAWLGWFALRLFGWWAFRRRDARAYTDKADQSKSCPRNWRIRLARVLVILAGVLGALGIVFGGAPLLRSACPWTICILPSLPLWPFLLLLLLVAAVLWALPGEPSRQTEEA
ncbi:MAG: DUF1353 domain-containing protein [Gemmatimonadetes bacterium]|nr:DUF1353 domain-containing protein [Gemmatimonadota bacterium]MYG23328.1 DUF1353 domain-containing protein [Gemmatimonadota bacterium]MYJ37442.1 DUF1353 domain-containing protein [Gemmatimonadota bacterium]